jgi:hypothetical protein
LSTTPSGDGPPASFSSSIIRRTSMLYDKEEEQQPPQSVVQKEDDEEEGSSILSASKMTNTSKQKSLMATTRQIKYKIGPEMTIALGDRVRKEGFGSVSFEVKRFTKQQNNPIELDDGSRPGLDESLLKLLPVHINKYGGFYKEFRRVEQYVFLRKNSHNDKISTTTKKRKRKSKNKEIYVCNNKMARAKKLKK